ncbi:MAG: fatty acid desaturase [Candidatus Eremiobacteraeota bacterium]|nr:fatty acid desaturase [Candidatus Eremiobacteraeota bacterium]MCW5867975.1 fatty acid desaturase [Candidatus Eremiobacteraeota bacterium]
MKIEYRRHAERIGLFAVLYLLGAGLAISHPGPWALPAYLLAAASLHGISLFAHEAVHGTLAPGPLANRILGALCAIPVWQNCSAYRVLHLRHHRHLGEDGDPDHYANYTRRGWLIFLMNWARLLVGYPVYISAIPVLGFRQGNWRDRIGILLELMATAMLVGWALHLPVAWLLHGWLIPMLFINTMVNIRGMSQHTLLEHANDEIQGTRSILTTPLVRFFMCNENYHLEHHLHPGVPWYGLPQLHQKLEPELRRQGAPYIRSYTAFVQEFLEHTWRKARE